MTRKLVSLLLSAFALLLLMGAGVEQDSAAVLVTEEESAAIQTEQAALETEEPIQEEQQQLQEDGAPAEAGEEAEADTASLEPAIAEEPVEQSIIVDGIPVSAEVEKFEANNVTYVALGTMVQELDETAQVAWDAGSSTVTVTTANLNLTASVGQLYLQANGRYLYIQDGVQLVNGRVSVPLAALVKAFDAALSWDGATGTISVTRGSGALMNGEQFYNEADLFWLSRVIHAESGNQPLEGRMAVGNVVLNRVKSPIFPNTVEGVLAQKNQFSTYKSGKLSERTPNEGSVIAAKLVLDGGQVAEIQEAMYFDSSPTSWAARNKTCVAEIGNHRFYR